MESLGKRRDIMRGDFTDGDDIHISDVIEAIQETDPEYKVNGSSYTPAFTPVSQGLFTDPIVEQKHRAKCIIIEQPASKALRFRYECEGRSAGSLPGASNTSEKKSFPAVKVEGYKGPAVVVVSCVTKDHPHRPHPHNLVGKEGCKKGVCTMNVDPDTMTCVFSNLGIQCVKKKYIEESLRLRESLQVDPFRTGFAHKSQPSSIDLNVVRLCFQVFLEGDKPGQFTFPLEPVVSTEIFDKKSMSDLVIIKMSHCSASVAGGQEVIVLCEKICRDDISLRFYEEQDNQIIWEAFGEFQPSDVHKQVAISFKTPKYKNIEVQDPVTVYVQLLRPSNGVTSSSKPFILTPLDSGTPVWLRKRRKASYSLFGELLSLQNNNTLHGSVELNSSSSPSSSYQGDGGARGPAFKSTNPFDEDEDPDAPEDGSRVAPRAGPPVYSKPSKMKKLPAADPRGVAQHLVVEDNRFSCLSDTTEPDSMGSEVDINEILSQADTYTSLNEVLSQTSDVDTRVTSFCSADLSSEDNISVKSFETVQHLPMSSAPAQDPGERAFDDDEEMSVDEPPPKLPPKTYHLNKTTALLSDDYEIPEVNGNQKSASTGRTVPPLPPKRVRTNSRSNSFKESNGNRPVSSPEDEEYEHAPSPVKELMIFSKGSRPKAFAESILQQDPGGEERHPQNHHDKIVCYQMVDFPEKAADKVDRTLFDAGNHGFEFQDDFDNQVTEDLYSDNAPMATASEFDDLESIASSIYYSPVVMQKKPTPKKRHLPAAILDFFL